MGLHRTAPARSVPDWPARTDKPIGRPHGVGGSAPRLDEGCCHRTRLVGAPCPVGRACPYDRPAPAGWETLENVR
jgi:hypothetical protein